MSEHVLFNAFKTAQALQAIDRDGAVGIPDFLTDCARTALLKELRVRHFVPAPERYGPFGVQQKFTRIDTFSHNGDFRQMARALTRHLNHKFSACEPYPFCKPLEFTDLVVQRYPVGHGGITPHRDGLHYINLIVVLVLGGQGRFCICDDREGTNPRPIHGGAGTMILMRGPGFLGANIQPFHFVDQITEERTTFALRQREKI